MEAGDTLLIRTHQLPNADGATEDGITLVLLSVPGIHDSLYDMFDPEGDDPLSVLYYYIIAHNATDFFFYAGSMGDVALPLDGSSDSPAFDNVDGWAVSDETMQPTDKVITKVSSDLLGDPSLWLDMDGLALLFLLPHLQEIIEGESWLGAITADRHFAESELPRPSRLPTAITVRGKAALSFLFVAQMETAGEVAALFFTAGLPAGTALTMIDLTEGPTYYFYIITDADVADGSNQQLPLSRFTEMGGGAAFTGCAERMLFQISYPDGEAPASESISIGISTEPAEISLSFTCRKTNEVDLGDREGEDYGYIEETLSIPSLSGRGYGANDQAVLVLRLYDKNGNALPLPANFLVEPTGGTLTTYSSFAYAPLGSVKYFTSAFSLSGKLHLSSLRYLGFEGTAVYEVVVLPAGTDLSEAVVGGTLATVDTRITCALTVNETPGFVLSTDRITASRGETVTLSAELEGHAGEAHEIELYILRREGTQMVYTDACADLLLLPPNGIPVPLDENGRVSVTLTTGTGSFKISENAAPGAYFLVAYYHGRYAVCTIIVTA